MGFGAQDEELKALVQQHEQRCLDMERQHQQHAAEAVCRVQALEQQALCLQLEGEKMVRTALGAKEAYQLQRAFIMKQLEGELASSTPAHAFLNGLVTSMDAQFGIQGVEVAAGSHGGSPASVSGADRVGRQDRRTGRRMGGAEDPLQLFGEEAKGSSPRRDRSPRREAADIPVDANTM